MAAKGDKETTKKSAPRPSKRAQEGGLEELFHLALRKLKGYAYWDKSQLVLVDQLVQYESRMKGGETDKLTARVCEALLSNKESPWESICQEILDSVGFLCYPKKVTHERDNPKCSKITIISEIERDSVRVDTTQYFLRMHPVGHLLSVIWTMTIGAALDTASKNVPVMYTHSYGNRLRKRLFVETPGDFRISDSPHFIEPYFSQYSNWRDQALERAQACVRNKQDVIIATLDIRKFFYCVDIDRIRYDGILEQYYNSEPLTALCTHYALTKETLKRLHAFVYRVMVRYSGLLARAKPFSMHPDRIEIRKNQVLLPIGFIPSLILSNWVLMPFDDAIVNRINPVYYGRYVDDIILVDKVKRNSDLYQQVRTREASEANLCQILFKDLLKDTSKEHEAQPTTKPDQGGSPPKQRKRANKMAMLCINGEFLTNTTASTSLCIQAEKLKCFYFEGGKPAMLLDCFQRQIAKNASGFRFLPELDDMFLGKDYSDIFDLKVTGSPNKLREVEGGELGRFATSKFLGKLYNIVHALRQENRVGEVVHDLSVLFKEEDLIDNYTLWERLLEIALLAGDYDIYATLVHSMFTGIMHIHGPKRVRRLQSDMKRYLRIAIIRTLSLVWGPHVSKLVDDINKKTGNRKKLVEPFTKKKDPRPWYIATAMTGRYTTPLPIWCADTTQLKEAKEDICLFTLEGMKAAIDWAKVEVVLPTGRIADDRGPSKNREEWLKKYEKLFKDYLVKSLEACDALPYVLSPGEIAYMYATFCMTCGRPLDTLLNNRVVSTCYAAINSLSKRKASKKGADRRASIPLVAVTHFPETWGRRTATEKRVLVQIGPASLPASAEELKLKVALANIRLFRGFAGNAMHGHAVLSYDRLRKFRDLMKQAQKERADILVLPEYALPHAWLPNVIRLCAKEQIAIITGVEPIPLGTTTSPEGVEKPTIYNLTAVILPYTLEDGSRFAHLTFHHKVHYAPGEIEMIRENHCGYTCGDTHHLFLWRGIWFSVFCCFELASIAERAAFGHIPDMTIAVEWNKDVEYFSSIVESLARDIYCYCVQVNSSEYGDNRIVTPMGRFQRDPVRIKGGKNDTVITHELDVKLLRDCQMDKGEAESKGFKPLPPGFDVNIAKMKRNGTLYGRLMQDLQPEASPTSSESEEGKATSKA